MGGCCSKGTEINVGNDEATKKKVRNIRIGSAVILGLSVLTFILDLSVFGSLMGNRRMYYVGSATVGIASGLFVGGMIPFILATCGSGTFLSQGSVDNWGEGCCCKDPKWAMHSKNLYLSAAVFHGVLSIPGRLYVGGVFIDMWNMWCNGYSRYGSSSGCDEVKSLGDQLNWAAAFSIIILIMCAVACEMIAALLGKEPEEGAAPAAHAPQQQQQSLFSSTPAPTPTPAAPAPAAQQGFFGSMFTSAPAGGAAAEVDTVGQWLDTLGLPQYKPAFRDNAIDLATLAQLTDSELESDLGVASGMHRKKILSRRSQCPGVGSSV